MSDNEVVASYVSMSQLKKIRRLTDFSSIHLLSLYQGKVISSKKIQPDDILHQFLPETGRKNGGKIPQLHPGVFI